MTNQQHTQTSEHNDHSRGHSHSHGHGHDHHGEHGALHGGGSGGQGHPEDWDRRYAEEEWPAQPDPLLVRLVSPLPPGRAIDLGSGPGRNGVWLATAGWDVTCVDASAVGLDQARDRAARAAVPITTVEADLTSYEPEAGAFDLVVVANIHFHAEQREHLFAAAAAALAPGGHLFVVGHHVDSLGTAGPPDPERLYTEELLAGSFPTLTVEQLERTSEGDTGEHKGWQNVYLWAVRPA